MDLNKAIRTLTCPLDMKKTRSAWGFAGFYGFMWTKEKKLYGGEAVLPNYGRKLTNKANQNF